MSDRLPTPPLHECHCGLGWYDRAELVKHQATCPPDRTYPAAWDPWPIPTGAAAVNDDETETDAERDEWETKRRAIRARLVDLLYETENPDADQLATALSHHLRPTVERLCKQAEERGAARVRAAVAEALEGMGDVWGGDAAWLTTGHKVESLLSDLLAGVLGGDE